MTKYRCGTQLNLFSLLLMHQCHLHHGFIVQSRDGSVHGTMVFDVPSNRERCFYQDVRVGMKLDVIAQALTDIGDLIMKRVRASEPSADHGYERKQVISAYHSAVAKPIWHTEEIQVNETMGLCFKNPSYLKVGRITVSLLAADPNAEATDQDLPGDLLASAGIIERTLRRGRLYQRQVAQRSKADEYRRQADVTYIDRYCTLLCLVAIGSALVHVRLVRWMFQEPKRNFMVKP